MMKALGVTNLTPELARALLRVVDAELVAIGNGERGERLEHDTTRAGTTYRAQKRWGTR